MSEIVIVTEPLDLHADVLIKELRARGETPVRLHPQDFPQTASLSLTLDNVWQGVLCVQGRKLHADEIRSVWWRRPGPYLLPELDAEEAGFVRDELHQSLRGFFEALDCFWMSRPEAIRAASYKLEQLKRASKLGFEVPDTLVTMVPEAVQAFYDKHQGQIIYKTFSQPILLAQPGATQVSRTVYAKPVSEEQLALLDTVKQAPCLFQAYVPKQLELRVTVIGHEVFAAAIHSQSNAATQHDWRHYDVDIPYTKFDLPEAVAQRCLDYVKSYGLTFSALDLILTPEGRYVFLENNPNGQWYFIEHAVPELPMTRALASCLIEGA